MAPQGFKKCSICTQKIPLTNGHNLCLFCLGVSHQTQSCSSCRSFSEQAIKLRLQRLRSFLYKKTLNPAMEGQPVPSPTPRLEVAKTAPSLAAQSLLSMTSFLTKPKNSQKSAKRASSKASARPAKSAKKRKDKDKIKKQKTTFKPAITPLPPAPMHLEESSRDNLGLSDREECAIPPAQAPHALLHFSPSSGHGEADASSSPALAHSSPRSSGWAGTDAKSKQESAVCTPEKRMEKRKYISPYQPWGHEGQYYHPQGPLHYGYHYDRYQPYPYHGYAYQEHRGFNFLPPSWYPSMPSPLETTTRHRGNVPTSPSRTIMKEDYGTRTRSTSTS